MQIGQSKRNKEAALKSFGEFFRLKDGPNRIRVLHGPIKRSRIWWPTRVIEDGEIKTRKKAIVRPDEGCILDEIASIERNLRLKAGEDNPRSSLTPSTRYYYLIFDEDKDDAVVEIGEFPYTVAKQLIDKEADIDSDDPTKLKYGLVFMFPWIIKKIVDPSKSRQRGTSYDVSPDPKIVGSFAGKIPAAALGLETEELMEKWGEKIKSVFTEEQWRAYEEYDQTLEEILPPNTPEEIENKLREFPIYLDSKEMDHYIFPDFLRKALKSELIKRDIPLLTEGKRDQSLNLKSKEELISDKSVETNTEAIEADFEIVNKELKDEPEVEEIDKSEEEVDLWS